MTPIWDKTEVAIEPFANTPYAALEKMKAFMLANAAMGLPPEKIGEVVLTALTTAKPRTRYTVAPNATQQFMTRVLPKRVLESHDRRAHRTHAAGEMIYRWPPK